MTARGTSTTDDRGVLAVDRCIEALDRVSGVFGPNVVYRSDVREALLHVLGRTTAEALTVGSKP